MEHGGDLAEVVGRLMHKDPSRRLSAGSAEEMLRKVLRDSAAKPDPEPEPDPVPEAKPEPRSEPKSEPESEPVSPPVPPQASPLPPRQPKKGVPVWRKVSAVAVCAALVAGLGWFAVEQMRKDGGPTADDRPGRGSPADPYIKTHPKLTVGVKDDQPGLSEKVKGGKYRGYEIEVAYAIAHDMGYSRDRVTFVPVSSENRSTILQKGDVDLVIATYSITEERKHAKAPDYSVAFAGPYYVASRSFMVRKKAKAGAIDDSRMLRKKQFEVCTARSSTYESWLPKAGYNMTESLPNGYERCVRDLLDPTSSVYAVSTDDVILAGFVKNDPGELKRLDSGPGAEGYGVAMKPDEKGLKAEVCSALKKIMTDGVWEQLYAGHLAPLLNRASPPNKPKLEECPS